MVLLIFCNNGRWWLLFMLFKVKMDLYMCVCDFDLEREKKMGQLSQNARLKKWISTDYFWLFQSSTWGKCIRTPCDFHILIFDFWITASDKQKKSVADVIFCSVYEVETIPKSTGITAIKAVLSFIVSLPGLCLPHSENRMMIFRHFQSLSLFAKLNRAHLIPCLLLFLLTWLPIIKSCG